MRHLAHVVLVLAAAVTGALPAHARELPARLSYTFYVDGVRVGHSRMAITRGGDALVFDSQTRVELGPNVIELTSRTVADPKTYVVREFSFEGTKGGMPVAAHVVFAGDSATGWVMNTEAQERRPRKQSHPGGFAVFEDWVMDLEVIFALRQSVQPAGTSEYQMLFPNSFLTAEALMGFTGEVAVESETRSMVGRMLEVAMSGGDPFESHVDPATGVPVYIHFPGSRTEAFRDDFFGPNPLCRYQLPTPAPER